MYQKQDKKRWSGRTDSEDGAAGYHWHQTIEIKDLALEPLPPLAKNQKGFVLLGFCSDEGVRRNKGRTGAREGPAAIRKACASLAWHYAPEKVRLFDGGDIICLDQNLEQAQDELQTCISKAIEAGYMPLVLGGGHEVAFGSFKGIHECYPAKTIGIINVDAHFDLRTYVQGGHSGSSFLQIAYFCAEKNQPFSYLVLGIQKKSNTRTLYQKARELSVTAFEMEELFTMSTAAIEKRIKAFIDQHDFIYLTLCMDVFDQAYAPAVSAPSACGLTPQIILPIIRTAASSGKLVLFDIAELNPRFDRDGQSARLAAHLIFSIVDDYAVIS
jgi:formiminoglutamase